MHDPVAHIETEHPEYTVERWPLRGALSCVIFSSNAVLISDELDDAGYRSSVCHEGIHLDRGDRCSLANTTLDARREQAVEREAARRLLSFDQLAAVIRTGATGVPDAELAARAGVDVHLFRLRVEMLTDEEWDVIGPAVDEQERWTVA